MAKDRGRDSRQLKYTKKGQRTRFESTVRYTNQGARFEATVRYKIKINDQGKSVEYKSKGKIQGRSKTLQGMV